MTSRQQATRRKCALVADLVSAIDRAELRAGDQIASLTALARLYELSKPTVLATLQPLLDDGTLRAVASVGIFVAEVHDRQPGCYVMLAESRQLRAADAAPFHNTAHGFEERIIWHGGVSAVLSVETYLSQRARGSLPPVRGVFSFTGDRCDEVLAGLDPAARLVSYLGGRDPAADAPDERVTYVDLDNVSGGRLATEELLRGGHERIAFLGIHAPGSPYFRWSRQRARGWAEALRRRRPRAELISIHPKPPRGAGAGHYERALTQVANNAADRASTFDACIGADDLVLINFAEQLHHRGVPQELWPAMVGFEGLSDAADYLVTSVRPRWADLGAMAADHLVRGTSRRRSTATVNEVAMTLIARPQLLTGTSSRR